jgi:hypothetical protein
VSERSETMVASADMQPSSTPEGDAVLIRDKVWTNGANENIDLLHSVLREIHE